ncbi:MAG: (2Fe-2S)-binding protein [Planococcus sp. (in: Bacteria)]|nr:(2Fe-2S)-binding protein [Planococcus sp. (in: firmicutes)]
MTSLRVDHHPVLGDLENQQEMNIYFDGQAYPAREGDTIASALLASGIRTLRLHEDKGTPRGIYCNIGHCFECRVTVDGKSTVRACLTTVEDNMQIESGKPLSAFLQEGGSL